MPVLRINCYFYAYNHFRGVTVSIYLTVRPPQVDLVTARYTFFVNVPVKFGQSGNVADTFLVPIVVFTYCFLILMD